MLMLFLKMIVWIKGKKFKIQAKKMWLVEQETEEKGPSYVSY